MFKATIKKFVNSLTNTAQPSYHSLNSEYWCTGLIGEKLTYLLLFRKKNGAKKQSNECS